MALEISLPGDTELRMSRTFAAAPELVWLGLTVPALLRRWYGNLMKCEIDLRPGGAWHFTSLRPDGREIGQFGIYREIETNARLVQTENWSDWNPGELLVTTRLIPSGTGTLLETSMAFPTQAVRDMLIKAGMNDEAEASYARMEQALADYQT